MRPDRLRASCRAVPSKSPKLCNLPSPLAGGVPGRRRGRGLQACDFESKPCDFESFPFRHSLLILRDLAGRIKFRLQSKPQSERCLGACGTLKDAANSESGQASLTQTVKACCGKRVQPATGLRVKESG